MCRGRILARIGSFLDEKLSGRIYEAVATLPLKIQGRGDGIQPLRDLDQVRGFLPGLGPAALFDLPWMPLYLGICFVFHIWIGVAALLGAIVLVSLTLWTEALTRAPAKAAAEANVRRMGLAEATRAVADRDRPVCLPRHLCDCAATYTEHTVNSIPFRCWDIVNISNSWPVDLSLALA